MKKNILFILLPAVIMLCTACGKQAGWDFEANKGIEWTKYQNYWREYCGYSASDTGYYNDDGFMYTDETGTRTASRLYFLDSSARKLSVLCNKPNCKHNDASCSAVFINTKGAVWYNNGYLFYIQENQEDDHILWRCKPDGTGRESLFTLSSGNEIYDIFVYIHGNKIFCSAKGIDNSQSIFYYDMELKERKKDAEYKKIIMPAEKAKMAISDIIDGKLLFEVEHGRFEDATADVYEYNYNTGEKQFLFTKNGYLSYMRYAGVNIVCTTFDGTLLYSPETNESVIINPSPLDYVGFDGTYIYVDNSFYYDEKLDSDNRIWIYDTDGVLVDTIMLTGTGMDTNVSCMMGDEHFLFKANLDIMYIFDKKQIGTSSREWIIHEIPE